ncbi:juvenile hormone esterase-like [Diabrotica undecimpunctata]|uniref:juvenile hormone esterase-like n=1 Tax=Diabrotica undecimpunctata TaxID=50387 RepID=UPI003B63D1FC
MMKICVIGTLLLGVIYCAVLPEYLDDDSVVVETTNGLVRGSFGRRSHADKNEQLYWFRSIPYAEPPVGELRFEAPVPKVNWSGILDVRAKPNICIQGSPAQGSEDCLTLKIYTSNKPDSNLNLPVVVWIYGGAFFGGSADFDDHSPDFLLYEDVIVVAVHYRVGFLGFMSLGDTVAPGNNGIKDQVLALQWIKKNIKNFGGDPEKITIWGQSAGAASVAYLLQAPQTKGLFSRAILNSGSSLSPWSLANGLPEVTEELAEEFQINTQSSSTILAGLKKLDVAELQEVANKKMSDKVMASNPVQGLVFTPVKEPNHSGAVITGNSHQLLKEGKFHHVPILAGYTSLEGYFDDLPLLLKLWLLKFDSNNKLLVPDDLNADEYDKEELGNNIKKQYFGFLPIAITTTRLMRFISDSQFERPIQEAIRLYSAYTNVYAYHFGYEGALWGRTERSTSGVGHTEDLGYLFDFGHKGSEADYLTRSRTVKLWTNFIKQGNPTPSKDSLLQNVTWPANSKVSTADRLKYLEINKSLKVVGLPNSSKIKFWNNMYQEYGYPPYSTY